jgi:glutathione peroxidase
MTTLNHFHLHALDGTPLDLHQFDGHVVLIVNVASRCGLTPQYKGLEALWREQREAGLTVLGLPCNQFGSQEPGSPEQIAEFCELNYGVTFPLSEKIDVNGGNRHPLYHWLAGPQARFPGDIQWNFEKFVIDRSGQVAARFSPMVKPTDPELLERLSELL